MNDITITISTKVRCICEILLYLRIMIYCMINDDRFDVKFDRFRLRVTKCFFTNQDPNIKFNSQIYFTCFHDYAGIIDLFRLTVFKLKLECVLTKKIKKL